MSDHAVTGTSVRGTLAALLKHKGKAAALFIAVVGAAILVNRLSPKDFQSRAKLFVRLGRENATIDPTATFGQSAVVAVPQSRENDITSAVEILHSRTLLEKTVDRLGPARVLAAGDGRDAAGATSDSKEQGWVNTVGAKLSSALSELSSVLRRLSIGAPLDDRQRAILLLDKNMRIDAPKKSSVIDISFEGRSPELCQAVVAEFVTLYLDEHLRLNRTQGTHEFLVQQAARLRQELARKEVELRDVKNETGLASAEAQRQILVTRIGRLEDELQSAETARVTAESRVDNLRGRLDTLPGTEVTAETSGFGNEGTDRMRDQFYALQLREKEAQAKLTEEHPKMRHLRDQVATARGVLSDEELGRKQVTKAPGRLRERAESTLLGEEPALASAQAQARQLRAALAEARQQLNALNTNELQIAALQRDIDLLDRDYRKYAVSREQSRIDEQLEAQRMSNVGIVQPASYEPKPIRPRVALNLLVGLCAALFAAVALPLVLEHSAGSSATADNRERLLNSPSLATVPRRTPERLPDNGVEEDELVADGYVSSWATWQEEVD